MENYRNKMMMDLRKDAINGALAEKRKIKGTGDTKPSLDRRQTIDKWNKMYENVRMVKLTNILSQGNGEILWGQLSKSSDDQLHYMFSAYTAC